MLRFRLGLYPVLCAVVLLSLAVQAIPFASLPVGSSTSDHVLDHAKHQISSGESRARELDARIFSPKNLLSKAQKDAKKLSKQVQNTVNTLGKDLQTGSSAVKAASENVLEAFVEATEKGTKNADKMLTGTAAQLEKLGAKMNPEKLLTFVGRFSSAAQQFIESLPSNNVNWLTVSDTLVEDVQKASKEDQELFSTFVNVMPAEVSDQVLSEDNVNQQSGSSSQTFESRFANVLSAYKQSLNTMQAANMKVGTQSTQVVSDATKYLTNSGSITAAQRNQLLNDLDTVADNVVKYTTEVGNLVGDLQKAKLSSGTVPKFSVAAGLSDDTQDQIQRAELLAGSLRAWRQGSPGASQQTTADDIRGILGLPPADPVPTVAEEELDTEPLTQEEDAALQSFLDYMPVKVSDITFKNYIKQYQLDDQEKVEYERKVLTTAGYKYLENLTTEANDRNDAASAFLYEYIQPAIIGGGLDEKTADAAIDIWRNYALSSVNNAEIAIRMIVANLQQAKIINEWLTDFDMDFDPPVEDSCTKATWNNAAACYTWLSRWDNNSTDQNGELITLDFVNDQLAQLPFLT
ncbi:uncharacterized protein N7459_003571 [Penicillium hispanicum]|uniref:uncharacterized protein n=1 Tax=Penicillium hispanicum TaxID=1080232 RepID=UPI0025403BE2|nr:uncharacterized protein N7459_003571 [Penicillium hispanicum]KAJ5587806.1 hypothetical protein N7459_003571 [Penicillium hispanicum]